jgi:Transposase.
MTGKWKSAKTPMTFCSIGRKKWFLHRIKSGEEKWIYFDNPKPKKSWVDPNAPPTLTARPNPFDRKTMFCVWWNQRGGVYYELLKPGETINTKRYQ